MRRRERENEYKHIGSGTTSADHQPEAIRGNHGVFAWIGDKAAAGRDAAGSQNREKAMEDIQRNSSAEAERNRRKKHDLGGTNNV